jgi:type II secretory pathway pseudopilin PulG
MLCPKCGASNDAAATFCTACGDVLPLPDSGIQKARRKTDGPADISEYYKAAIGPKNQEYYLRQFARFDANGKVSASWHWPAFFVTFYWMLYRKMWLYALIYFFFPYVLFGLTGATMGLADGSANFLIGATYLLYIAGILFLVPMYASALYYNHCKKQIAATKASTTDVQRQLGELAGKGGTSNIVILFLLFFVLIALLGIVAAVAIPAYQDYTTRARVAQAYELGRSAADSVTGYYNLNKELPGDLDEAGFSATLPPSVSEITMDSQYGTLTITMNGAVVGGKSLSLDPALDEDKKLYWSCTSVEIQEKYLPQSCRQSN